MKNNAKEQLESLKSQKAYTTKVLNNGGLELWEAKEYSSLEKHISEHSEVFNKI